MSKEKKFAILFLVVLFVYGCTIEYELWKFAKLDFVVEWKENKVN